MNETQGLIHSHPVHNKPLLLPPNQEDIPVVWEMYDRVASSKTRRFITPLQCHCWRAPYEHSVVEQRCTVSVRLGRVHPSGNMEVCLSPVNPALLLSCALLMLRCPSCLPSPPLTLFSIPPTVTSFLLLSSRSGSPTFLLPLHRFIPLFAPPSSLLPCYCGG